MLQSTDTATAVHCLGELATWRRDDYETWLQVGMILKDAGCSVSDWEAWSKASSKWKPGVCERKWQSFNGALDGGAVGVGTLIEWVRQDGGSIAVRRDSGPGHALTWDSDIGPSAPGKAAERSCVPAPAEDWQPKDLARYLSALFRPEEHVAYVMDSWPGEDGKLLPKKGVWSRTAKQILEAIEKHSGDLRYALGDWNEAAGAWIRINPVDGGPGQGANGGLADGNITDYRHVLVESDKMPVEDQLRIIQSLNLPCAAIVHSGGKSIHAIVRVDAGQDRKLYSERVSKLFAHLREHGFEVDRPNRNPSRLSRMPAITRNGNPQYLISGPCGAASWAEWDQASSAEIDLPDVRLLSEYEAPGANDPTELLKSRFLCRGGALLFPGPTGVGKSSLVMQACMKWAVGQPFFGIRPAGELRTLVVQAENDHGDIAEMRDGIFAGLIQAGEIREEDRKVISSRIRLVCEDMRTGDDFGRVLDRLLHRTRCDLLVIDPALAYLGGDALKQADVTKFLRNIINPIIHKHLVGLILVHHTNKPPKGEESRDWRAGEFAYLGQGAADWANWARGVIGIRSIGSHTTFELVLGKRGGRVGWRDPESNEKVFSRFIAHAREDGMICWREADDEEVLQAESDRKSSASKPRGAGSQKRDYQATIDRAIEIAGARVWKKADLRTACVQRLDISPSWYDKNLKEHIQNACTGDKPKLAEGQFREGKRNIYLIGPADGSVEKAARETQNKDNKGEDDDGTKASE